MESSGKNWGEASGADSKSTEENQQEKGDLGVTDARNWILPTGMTLELDYPQSL